MNVFLLLVLLCLGVFRAQRVVTRDDWPPMQWFRARVASSFGADSGWYGLVTCPWCLGAWAAAGAVWAVDAWWTAIEMPVLWWGAVSAAAGLLAQLDDALSS